MGFALFRFLFALLLVWVRRTAVAETIENIIDAINAGGKTHTDIYGITYRTDPLEGKVGSSSDYGKRFLIGRVTPEDQILYQTERYHTGNFEYTFRIPEDGEYVLVLKFSEVYFNGPGQKVFDVVVNDLPVVTELDIFAKVGRAVAHDEQIPFSVRGGKLRIQDEASDFDGKLSVQFVKGLFDNPKVNALYIKRGTLEDVAPLPPLDQPEEEEKQETEDDPLDQETRQKFASGPKAPDPYAQQDQSQMLLPILIALACFFPVLFCLCRL